jgi:FkbM family methyltransferase
MIKKSTIYERFSKEEFYPSHVAEVGVYHPETSTIYEYLIEDVKCTLVEPDPHSTSLIKNHFRSNQNLILHEVAIYDSCGNIDLVKQNASTYVAEIDRPPSKVNDESRLTEADKFTVEATTFDQIDDGTIDLLSIDIEGCEWYVLKYMISRPQVISLETHGGIYINPFKKEILNWMSENNYIIYYKTASDSIFVRKDKFKITSMDKIELLISDIIISARRNKKKIKRFLLGKP